MKIKRIAPKWNDMPKPVPLPKDFHKQVLKAANSVKANRGRGVKTYTFVHFFQDWDGEILETIYGVKYYKAERKNPEYAEYQLAFAGTPTRRWGSGNLLHARMCGWFLLWKSKDYKVGYFYRYEFDTNMYKADSDKWRPHLSLAAIDEDPTEPYGEIASLRNYPKYFNVETMMGDIQRSDIIQYLRNFIDYPQLERLQKMKLSFWWNELRILKASKKTAKDLLTYIRKYYSEIVEKRPSLSTVLAAKSMDMSLAEFEHYEKVCEVDKALCGVGGWFPHEQAEEVTKYLSKQKGNPIHYRDYLDLSAKAGRDMDSRGVLFPRDYCEQFLELQKIVTEAENRERNAKIAKTLEKLNLPRQFSKSGLEVRPLTSQEEMIDMGNRLHNCVGTCGYGAEMADGTIVILAVYQNGIPMNCVELLAPRKEKSNIKAGNTYKVLQNHGDHNENSPVQRQAEEAIDAYIIKATMNWRKLHATA